MTGEERRAQVARFRQMRGKERLRHIWDYERGWILAAAAMVLLLLVILPRSDSRQALGVCFAQSAAYDNTCTLVEQALQRANILEQKIEVNALAGAAGLDEKTQLTVAVAAGEADCVICDSALMLELAQDGFLQVQPDGSYGIKIGRQGFNMEETPFYLCVLKNADEAAAEILCEFVRELQ